jgi:predicted DNA-binding transcriptional regulator YafY
VNRTDRLYAIVEELRAVGAGFRTAQWLAERFEVSVRTIERDLGALQQAGVPIYATPGRRGGYGLDEIGTLPPMNFTPEEATAIALALERQPAGPFAQAARVALLKIVGAMSGGDAEAAERLAARVRLMERAGPRPRSPVPSVVERGIVDRRVVRLTYQDDEGTITHRDVEPVSLVGSDSHWYLVAWCRLREAGRVFRMDRIRSARLTTETAPERSLDLRAPDQPVTRGITLR